MGRMEPFEIQSPFIALAAAMDDSGVRQNIRDAMTDAVNRYLFSHSLKLSDVVAILLGPAEAVRFKALSDDEGYAWGQFMGRPVFVVQTPGIHVALRMELSDVQVREAGYAR